MLSNALDNCLKVIQNEPMKTKAFLIGVMFGALFSSLFFYWFRDQELRSFDHEIAQIEDSMNEVESSTENYEEDQEERSVAEYDEQGSADQILINQASPAPQSDNQEVAPIEEAPRYVKLMIDEDQVSQLEDQSLESLKSMVKVVRHSEGWTVIRIQQGSLFSQLNLRSGDLIDGDALNEVQSDPVLVNRFVKILESIEE
ncbi:MAG: hypothetical protein CL678_11380 [Bdellovibrionaceae bacterium]|nr:hypothetical protein [Pseudobdellovibrionaceae bacterium]